MALQWPYFLGIRKGCLQLACQVDKSIFYWYFGVLPAQRRSLLWWTLALICDLRPPLNCQRPRRRGTPPPPSSRSIRNSPVRQGRTVRLHSLVSHSGWPCTDIPSAQTILPPALGHLAVQTAPAHKCNRQRVSVGLGGQECWPACAVQHIQSTSPQTPAYLTSQS